MTRDHLLGFPALMRQHDEPAPVAKPAVKERPAAFVAFETGNHLPTGMWVGDPKAAVKEINFPDVHDAVFRVLGELGKPAAKALLAEFGVEKIPDLERKQWAEVIATAERRLDGWIKWDGGDQPVADDVAVEVRYVEGTRDYGPADDWDWKHYADEAGDIVEYRVVK